MRSLLLHYFYFFPSMLTSFLYYYFFFMSMPSFTLPPIHLISLLSFLYCHVAHSLFFLIIHFPSFIFLSFLGTFSHHLFLRYSFSFHVYCYGHHQPFPLSPFLSCMLLFIGCPSFTLHPFPVSLQVYCYIPHYSLSSIATLLVRLFHTPFLIYPSSDPSFYVHVYCYALTLLRSSLLFFLHLHTFFIHLPSFIRSLILLFISCILLPSSPASFHHHHPYPLVLLVSPSAL